MGFASVHSLRESGTPAAAALPFRWLYYIVHRDNLASIMRWGILSHSEMARRQLAATDISDPGAQRWRARLEPVHERAIHDYVPLYLNPKNPMLYKRRGMQRELVVLALPAAVIAGAEPVFSDGNAASACTRFSADPAILAEAAEALRAPFWTNVPDGKRKRCAEALIYRRVAPTAIRRILCHDAATARAIGHRYGVAAAVPRSLYFD